MHSTIARTQARAERVLRARIKPFIHRRVAGLTLEAWAIEGGQGEPVDKRIALGLDLQTYAPSYLPFEVGQPWGPAWGTTWFRVTGTVPADCAPGDRLELIFDLGWRDGWVGFHCEALVMTPQGRIMKALNPMNRWVDLAEIAGPGQNFELYVEAASNAQVLDDPMFNPTGAGEKDTAGPDPKSVLRRAEIAVYERELAELALDLEVVVGLAAEVSDADPRHHRLLVAADRAMDELDPQDLVASATRARAHLAVVLTQPAAASAHIATAVGHSHIDSAWLWPVRETARKVVRTVANTLNLMDEDPDFIYAMSSAQQYAWVKEHAPELFERLTQRVADGRFIPVGGMWVESDVNMPSGESMVRQMLTGQRFMREHFGAYNTILWLPDSFGYSGALPQLAKLGGFTSFLTQKISWNDTNKFPHHTFMWQGIDGTQLLTHFPPADTYNAEITPRELGHAVANFQDKAWSNHSLIPFGYGDGGGGPTREMLGRVDRQANLEGSARVTQRAPQDFFADLAAEVATIGAQAPVWVGEMALELHRATFTTQVAMKQGNRRSEALLREVEARATAAMLAGQPYPHDELERIWHQVLLNQFHDILPGSSIAWVHREARATYAALDAQLRALAATADAFLDPFRNAQDAPGSDLSQVRVSPEARTIENAHLSMAFDEHGYVTSWRDLAGNRELVPAGARLGELRLLRDQPVAWDAWDVDRGARRTATPVETPATFESRMTGQRTGLRVTQDFGRSTVHTDYLVGNGGELEVTVEVDWHESERFLTIAFPLDIATTTAKFETQFGYVTRTLHENTSWDWAQFETCAHRYIHVSEPGYGVAVTNDANYGHEVATRPGGGVEVIGSIVRAPHFPDPHTDQGVHTKTWVLAPTTEIRDVVALAQDTGRMLAPIVWPAHVQAKSGTVILDGIKAAEDRSGEVILRLYEPAGGRATASIELAGAFGANPEVTEVNLLEDPYSSGALTATGGAIELSLTPFQIVSLRVRPGR